MKSRRKLVPPIKIDTSMPAHIEFWAAKLQVSIDELREALAHTTDIDELKKHFADRKTT